MTMAASIAKAAVDLATGNATLDLLRGGTYDPHVEKLLDGVVIPSLVSYEKV